MATLSRFGAPMGMFDHLLCEVPLPVPAVNGRLFQTKSFHRNLDTYTVRKNGTLWRTEFTTERQAGATARHHPRDVPCEDFSGEVRFYRDYGNEDSDGFGKGWVEFRAEFAAGRLQSLELAKHTEPPEVAAARKRASRLDRKLPPTCSGTPPRL